jgi:hypothetical protein
MTRTAAVSFALLLLSLIASRGVAAPLRITGWVISPDLSAVVEISPAFLRSPAGRSPQPADTARPRSDGSFTLTVPAPGVYRAVLRAEGFVPLEIALLPVVEETELPPAVLEPAVPLEIRAVGPDGRPATGVAVCARSWTEDPWGPAERCGTTGVKGRLLLLRGREERPVLLVTDPRFAPRVFETGEAGVSTLSLTAARAALVEVRRPDGRPAAGVEARIGLGSAGFTDPAGRLAVAVPEEGAEVEFLGADGLRARVVFVRGEAGPRAVVLEPPRFLAGRVLDAVSRAPLHGALVWGGEAATRTAADGTFRLPVGSGPGLSVEAAAAGHERQVSFVRSGAGAVTLALPPAAGPRGGGSARRGFGVSGRVLDERGNAVPGAWIFLEGEDPEERWLAVADAGGAFLLTAIPEKEYRLSAVAPGFARPEPRRVRVAGGPLSGLEMRLARSGTIVGRLAGLTAEELDGLLIMARPAGVGEESGAVTARRLGLARADGRYRIPDVPPGRWEVTVLARTGRRALGSIDVAPGGGETALDLRLGSALTLSGRLRVDGRPAAGTILAVSPEGDPGAASAQAPVGPDGVFALHGLPPSRYLLLVILDSAPWPVRTVELAADQSVILEIATGTLTGRILGPDGAPLAGARIEVRPRASGVDAFLPGPRAQSDERGAFELPRLPAGSHRLLVTRPGAAPVESVVTVPPGGRVWVDIPLGSGQGLQGQQGLQGRERAPFVPAVPAVL